MLKWLVFRYSLVFEGGVFPLKTMSQFGSLLLWSPKIIENESRIVHP